MTYRPHVGILRKLTRSPLGQRLLWVLFAIVFYYAGLAFTTWLLEPDKFAGGASWILVGLFPILVPAFFIVNRRLGCASGQCADERCETPGSKATKRDERIPYHQRPPG